MSATHGHHGPGAVPCLIESAASFAVKFAEGAIGKSGRKISVKGLQAKWAGILHKQRSKVRIEGYEKAASNELGQAKLTAACSTQTWHAREVHSCSGQRHSAD